MNKLLLLLSTILIMSFYPFLVKGQNVFINEYSQGHAGHSHDWVELVVTSDNTDIRGLNFTSYGFPGYPQFTLKLSRNSNFTNLPKGSIIVLYANFETSIGDTGDSYLKSLFPNGDLDFTDNRVVIPFDSNDINTTYFTADSHWPVLPNDGTNIALFDSTGNTGIFGLHYGNNGIQDDSLFTVFGKVHLGTINNGSSTYFTGDAITSMPDSSANWQIVASNTATPGSLNGGDNDALPVELDFFAGTLNGSKVELRWRTVTEVNNYGFDIERKISLSPPEGGNSTSWNTIGFVEGHGNTNSPKHYSFVDNEINQSGIYYYRLKQIDNDGTYEYSNLSSVNVGVPSNFYLSQNYPNPFNPTTKIDFRIPAKQLVSLRIYNILGDLVKELVNEEKAAGSYSITFNASNLPSGVYIYRLQTPSFSQNRKMTLLK